MGKVLRPRAHAYLTLLSHGLVLVRNLAFGQRHELCGIEADHLHNIPGLVHEDNERRHLYYILTERASYLQRLRELGEIEYLDEVSIWYSEPWQTLASAAGVQLSE